MQVEQYFCRKKGSGEYKVFLSDYNIWVYSTIMYKKCFHLANAAKLIILAC